MTRYDFEYYSTHESTRPHFDSRKKISTRPLIDRECCESCHLHHYISYSGHHPGTTSRGTIYSGFMVIFVIMVLYLVSIYLSTIYCIFISILYYIQYLYPPVLREIRHLVSSRAERYYIVEFVVYLESHNLSLYLVCNQSYLYYITQHLVFIICFIYLLILFRYYILYYYIAYYIDIYYSLCILSCLFPHPASHHYILWNLIDLHYILYLLYLVQRVVLYTISCYTISCISLYYFYYISYYYILYLLSCSARHLVPRHLVVVLIILYISRTTISCVFLISCPISCTTIYCGVIQLYTISCIILYLVGFNTLPLYLVFPRLRELWVFWRYFIHIHENHEIYGFSWFLHTRWYVYIRRVLKTPS